MAKSLQDILRRRQREDFVGREKQLIFFRRNLRWEVDDPRRRFVINIYGQGGVGKTWLLRRFRKIAEEYAAVTAYTDETEDDVPSVMGRIAEQFETQEHPLKTFAEGYKVYRQRRQEIEVDPEAPQGFSAFLGRTLAKGGLRLARQVPVGGVVADLMDEEAFASLAGDFSSYVARKIRNKDEVRLVLEPVEVLTPLFTADLREVAGKHSITLFFDTYERTGEFLDPWLQDLLEGRHGDVPTNITLVVGGRDELDRNLWGAYEGLLARLPLEPFIEEEARDYLARKYIADEEVVEVILQLSGRLPLLVATLAVESPDDPTKAGDPSGQAVKRFLKWVEDLKQRQVALDAALPRRLNRDVLAVLVGEKEADTLFAWLEGVPFVERRSDAWAYHDVVRTQMVHYKHQESPKRWADLHGRLAEYYEGLRNSLGLEEEVGRKDETWQGYALEALYHRLCQSPTRQLTAALNGFLAALETQRSLARRWAQVVGDAGEDANARSLQQWGRWLVEGLKAYDRASYEPTAGMFTALLKFGGIEERWRPIVLAHRGVTYLLMARNKEALDDFDRAIKLKPDNAWAIAHRGETYWQMGRYKEALADFDQAIELKDDYTWAIVRRGETYRQMDCYEEALADFDRAIELEPENTWAIGLQGETYRQMGQYEKSLTCFSRAIELNSEYTWAIVRRGETYRQMGRYEEALAEFDRAIELDPDHAWALVLRGLSCLLMACYPKALADFDRAIKLESDNAWAIAHRGETYRQMGRYEEALVEFDRAIELSSDYTWPVVLRGETYRQMGCYEEALADFDRAIELELSNPWIIVLRGKTHQQMGQYEKALADFDKAIKLEPHDAWAITHRGETYRQMRCYEEALADFGQAIDLRPDDAQGFYHRALTYQALGQIDRASEDLTAAMQCAKKVCEKVPRAWRNALNLAFYHLAAGEAEEAERIYREALSSGALPYHVRESIRALQDSSELLHEQARAVRDVLQELLEEDGG